MFAKKLLSLVALLFVGSQISTVSAACIPTSSDGTTCDGSSCDNEDADGYYFVASHNILVEITGSVSEATCTKVQTPGYYIAKNGDNYYKVTHGTLVATTVGSTGVAGEFVNEGAFSLDGTNSITLGDGENYLFTDSSAVFVDGGSAQVVLTSPDENSIILKAGLASDDYCVSNTKVVKGGAEFRIKGFCAASQDCVSQVSCVNSVCTALTTSCTRAEPEPCNPKTAPDNCVQGYYIIGKSGKSNANELIDDATVESGVGELYYCNGPNDCGSAIDKANYPTGYLVNADSTATSVKYIQCTKGGDCKGLVESSITAANCDGASVKAGDLIYVDTVGYKLCITKGTTTGVSIANTDKYFICYEASMDNAFTGKIPDGYCGIVEMTTTDITLKAYVGSTSPKYVYTNANQKVYDSANNEICQAPNTITEFKSDYCADKASTDATDYYVKGSTTTGPLSG